MSFDSGGQKLGGEKTHFQSAFWRHSVIGFKMLMQFLTDLIKHAYYIINTCINNFFSFSHWNIQYAPIKYPVKFPINQFILNPCLASSWAVFYPSAVSSFNSSLFFPRFGPTKCTTCLVSSSWYLSFWLSLVRRLPFYCAISICVRRTTTGGGDLSLRLALQLSIFSSIVAIIL